MSDDYPSITSKSPERGVQEGHVHRTTVNLDGADMGERAMLESIKLPQAEEDEGARDDMVEILMEVGVEEGEAQRVVAEASQDALRHVASEQEAAPGDWRIRNRDDLEFALKRIRQCKTMLAEHLEAYAKERARLDERFERICKPLEGTRDRYLSHVEVYAREHRQELLGNGERKTWEGMNGSISFRDREEGHWRLMKGMENRLALVRWAQKQDYPKESDPLVLPGEPKPNLDAIKAYLEARETVDPETGEVLTLGTPPGLEWVPPGTTLTVTTGEE